MATGAHSPQYISVRRNYESLAKHLLVNKTSKTELTWKYIAQGWIAPHDSPSENELISQVLERIEHDPKVYDVFIEMLEEIAGTTQIIQKLTGRYNNTFFIIAV